MGGSFEYRTVCWWRHYRSRWRHIKKRLGRLIDFGLNFNLIKKFWGFPYHSPHNKVKRTPYFQIFYSTKNRDIDSKSINKGLFLAKSSMENSISLSVFWNFDVWYSCELMISLANMLTLLSMSRLWLIMGHPRTKEVIYFMVFDRNRLLTYAEMWQPTDTW